MHDADHPEPTGSTGRPITADGGTAAATSPAGLLGSLGRAAEIRNIGLIAVLAVLAGVGALTRPEQFFTTGNLVTLLMLASIIGVITVGMTFVIISGGIDLSVGAVMALASVWATTLETQSYGPAGVVWTALLVGTLTGLINGLLIAYGRVVSFIATLAMLAGARGLAQLLSDKQTQILRPEADAIKGLATTRFLGLPLLVYLFLAVVVAGWVLLNRTTYGRRTFAVGGNPEAARLAGIPVKRHIASVYALSGLCAGIAAVMIIARTTTGSSTHGELYELDAIGAVVIGGTLLSGGRGTLVGSILGVLVFTTLTNLFIINRFETEIQNIAKGVIIVLAVLVQQWLSRRTKVP